MTRSQRLRDTLSVNAIQATNKNKGCEFKMQPIQELPGLVPFRQQSVSVEELSADSCPAEI